MKPIEHFRYCPQCSRPQIEDGHRTAFQCKSCGFLYHFNPAIAAAAFILDDQRRTLFIRRAKEPGQGKLAVPGGFVEAGESAESAVCREAREEVNLELISIEYLCSQPNDYPYRGVIYPVLDLYFVAKAERHSVASALDEVTSVQWLDASQVPLEDIAFESMRRAQREFLSRFSAR
jgi:NADH pyrophosphatase NudC (nudix superfamily)